MMTHFLIEQAERIFSAILGVIHRDIGIFNIVTASGPCSGKVALPTLAVMNISWPLIINGLSMLLIRSCAITAGGFSPAPSNTTNSSPPKRARTSSSASSARRR